MPVLFLEMIEKINPSILFKPCLFLNLYTITLHSKYHTSLPLEQLSPYWLCNSYHPNHCEALNNDSLITTICFIFFCDGYHFLEYNAATYLNSAMFRTPNMRFWLGIHCVEFDNEIRTLYWFLPGLIWFSILTVCPEINIPTNRMLGIV